MVKRRSKIEILRKNFKDHYSYIMDNGDAASVAELTRNPKFDHRRLTLRQLECETNRLLTIKKRIQKDISSRKHVTGDDQDTEDGSSTTSITDLPDYILMDIYAKLPLKSAYICRCVSKDWYDILKNAEFVNFYLKRSPVCLLFRNHYTEKETRANLARDLRCYEFEYDWKASAGNLIPHTVFKLPREYSFCPKPIVNSCNGLLCLHGMQRQYPISSATQFCETTQYLEPIDKYVVAIYNPTGAEYSILPIPEGDVSVCGLGFASNQYKVLLMRNLKSDCNRCDISSMCSNKVAMIFPLGSGKRCKRIETPPCFECCSIFEPAYLNGTLYWLVQDSTNKRGIMSFDFETETFYLLPSSPLTCSANTIEDRVQRGRYMMLADTDVKLGTIRGNLFMAFNVNIFVTDIWTMRGYGADATWIKEYRFDTYKFKAVLPGLRDLDNSWDLLSYSTERKSLYFIDKQGGIKNFKLDDTTSNLEIFSYVPSHLSLKDIMGDYLDVLKVI